MKTKKIISAGPLVKVAIYPRAHGREQPKVRAAKRKLSSEAQQRMNAKYSYQKLELQLAANYVPGDKWMTLTCDDAHLPVDRPEANKQVKAFLRKLRRSLKGTGVEPVVHWVIEHKHEHEDHHQDGRWHYHLCINAAACDYEMIRSCWTYGSNVHIRSIKIDKDHSYESLARYMCKEARDKPGQRSWSYTRNANHPEVETFPVPDDTPLEVPEGATLYESASERTEYGEFRYVKYLAPNWRRGMTRPRARKRRR